MTPRLFLVVAEVAAAVVVTRARLVTVTVATGFLLGQGLRAEVVVAATVAVIMAYVTTAVAVAVCLEPRSLVVAMAAGGGMRVRAAGLMGLRSRGVIVAVAIVLMRVALARVAAAAHVISRVLQVMAAVAGVAFSVVMGV